MDLSSRVTQLNHAQPNEKGRYVLYWMQMFKRASHNYALNFAIQMANELRLPLVVYEGLKFYYPWASDRLLLVHLNNKYALDGRDPNSYAGILWCFGKHDRPWFEREIFGTIRYITSRSMAKKFDSKRYIAAFGER
jgi:deoxyribodipyrimidine photolyase